MATPVNCNHLCRFVRRTFMSSVKCSRLPLGASLIQHRNYGGLKVPKRFKKKKDRNKKNRDDVYFIANQVAPMHLLDDAIDCVRAYSLFGPEPIDILLHCFMGQKKTHIGVLKGLVHLPKPVIPAQTILVFAEGEAAEQAKQYGASIVGGVELIKQVEAKELEFDHCISTLDFLPKLKHLPKILRNKMPHVRRGTATDDIRGALQNFRFGETYGANAEGKIRQTIALTSFSNDEVRKNIVEFMTAVESQRTVSREKFFQRAGIVIPPGPKLDLIVGDLFAQEELAVSSK